MHFALHSDAVNRPAGISGRLPIRFGDIQELRPIIIFRVGPRASRAFRSPASNG